MQSVPVPSANPLTKVVSLCLLGVLCLLSVCYACGQGIMSSTGKKVVYVEFTKSALNIWKHFLRAIDGQSAKCKNCYRILKTAGGATTGLHTHLRSKHPDIAFPSTNLEADNESSVETAGASTSTAISASSTATDTPSAKQGKKRKLVTDYFKSDGNESMETIVSRMTALDGVSFRLFYRSQDLRKLFLKSGYELPKSGNTIAKIVFNHAESTKEELKKNIVHMKNEGIRFTVTLDEWTSLRSRRYMNINIHSKEFGGFQFKNLGLVRITGSMPGHVALEILGNHLLKFHVSIDEDIIGITTDGASVMKKMGTYFHGHHQLCLAHGLQLAVIDTVYKDTTRILEPAIEENYPSDTSASDTGSDEDEDEDGQFEVEVPRVRANPYLHKEIIAKVRRVVKMIRKSPLKSDALQAYVTQEFNQNMQLQLDCQTRWSSMAEMIGSFLKIKTCVMKVLIDFKSQESFSEEEIQCLIDIHESLEIVKLTVLSLCRREATLYTADTALRFMVNKLDERQTSLSLRLAANLRTRIKERRLLVAGVLHYLHDAESFYASPDDETFRKPISDEICDIVVHLLQQIKYRALTCSPVRNDLPGSSVVNPEEPRLTFQEELDKELEKCKDKTPATREFDLRGFVLAEKAMYDNQGERGVYLTEAYKYLLSILPTSVENERIFSSAGYFCNKVRSSLSDRMIDSLSFLRTFFQEKRSLQDN